MLMLLCRCDGLLRVAAFEGLKKFTSVCEICPPHLVFFLFNYFFLGGGLGFSS